MCINTLLNSKVQILMYIALLSVNVTLFFHVSRLEHCQMFCLIYSLVLISISYSLFCCLQVLYRFYFSSFPFFFHVHCLFICATFFHLCQHSFQFLLFCKCWIQPIEFNNVRSRYIFLTSILILSNVASFCNELHIFLYQ